ncbi:MAG: hypothetical protein RIA69_07595 [Cyclobacteriaceae bacterium]
MTDEEFEILDELYFVQKYEYLFNELNLTKDVLVENLIALYHKGWIKILSDVDLEASRDQIKPANLEKYYFLATKKGLLAHNS